jgi:arginyl-tRNA synthetase
MTYKKLLEEIQFNIEKIIEEQDWPKLSFVVEIAKSNFGDVTCNVSFLIAKHLKKKPYDIAKIILEKYQPFLGTYVKKVDAHKSGFLNFFANYSRLNEIILKTSSIEDYGFVDIGKKTKLVWWFF